MSAALSAMDITRQMSPKIINVWSQKPQPVQGVESMESRTKKTAGSTATAVTVAVHRPRRKHNENSEYFMAWRMP